MVTSYTTPSLYDHVHQVTGHPGKHGMAWHRDNSENAAYNADDEAVPRPVCTACINGTMHQVPTDHRRVHRPPPTIPGQQFALDAFTHNVKSARHYRYCDLLTDLATGQTYPVFTKNRSADELATNMKTFFDIHPAWHVRHPSVPKFIRCDAESNYKSKDFLYCISRFGYELERSPPRDKHANGIAERAVGSITAKTNLAMLAPTPPVPQRFWDLAMSYACTTKAFNYTSRIKDSPYHFAHQRHINIMHLHPFWSRCYVYIPTKNRPKLGSARAYKAHFVGYNFTTVFTPNYLVMEVYTNGTYGVIRSSKDVIFDSSINFKDTKNIPEEELFHPTDSPTIPTTATVQAPLAAPITAPALEISSPTVLHSSPDTTPDPPIARVTQINRTLLPNKSTKSYNQEEDAIYWYSTFIDTHEYCLSKVETAHVTQSIKIVEPYTPKNFWDAMRLPEWEEAINKERGKFEKNNCLQEVPFTGQHLVPMMWLFNIKTDGTKKARLVGRGDMMIPWVDFDPNAVYCGNVSASSIKIALIIAASYKLIMRGGDLVGAYLVTLANPDYPVFIKTPQGYNIGPGMCIQAVGNLYGFPPAGQNFSKQFDKCVLACGYKNTPWDPKLFYKWINNQPLIIMAHSDDFRWFGPQDMIAEWDLLIATFNKSKYEVTDATNKEFVGIRISHDKDYNYYMDQERMIHAIITDINMNGAKDAKLPYPMTGASLSKADCALPEEKDECSKFPYRRLVGQLMYGMVHTMAPIMYALNVLTRYGSNPGPRHIEFLKHLLRYAKYSKQDRLKFATHNGPKDIKTMTAHLQLRFQCDADLGGNLDNYHSQTSYLGYLAGSLFCWCSTDQGSVSTSTAESEIKAVNHTLKCEVIADRGMLDMMGWKQEPTVIEEDNSACVQASHTVQITRGLRHLPLAENWFKEKVNDGTCIIEKVDTANNNADIGTKRLDLPLFTKFASQLVDRSLRNNL